ncbi:hypothetical protein MA16_Dca003353 [Dendrobium catenatum]|uniref:DUF8040 domain-containing protein n=1 Tax=Dendrobium catenatum TaxID=906689 RepID=A0A2I0XCH2_9ASPA|nr:hypothetical protein MA16_Dca003353 [Dendrobium catenatum]
MIVSIICMLLHEFGIYRKKYNLQRNIQHQTYIFRLYNICNSDCIDMVRMRREPFFNLCDLMRIRQLLVNIFNIQVEEYNIAMLLHTLGHNVCNRVFRFNFQHSCKTIRRYFIVILHVIGELRHEFIKPQLLTTPYKI